MPSSNDRNPIDTRWADHYAEASKRRRERGWHRREKARSPRREPRLRNYVILGVALFALTVLAVVLPK
ncbi:MAG TPA: hypothetical protein VHJ20_15165 [Polyangia bacterium]|nr:hypothetical protein [Polyangia bacterium]